MDELFGFPAGLRSFFLGQISEPSNNQLTLLLLEGAPQGPVVEIENLGIFGRSVSPLNVGDALEIHWESYVSYAVRNESYAYEKKTAHEEEAPIPENMLIERNSSAFTDFISNATWATDDHPGKLRYFQIICENHIIDVVSTQAPIIVRRAVDPSHLMEDFQPGVS